MKWKYSTNVLVRSVFVFLSFFLIGIIPSVFASQAVSMTPLDVTSELEQAAQLIITVYQPAEGGSVDILIRSPSNSPYTQDDLNRILVQSPKGNVALGFDPNDNTLLTGKVDTFTGSEGQIEIPISITVSEGAPVGEYDVSVNSVLPNGGTNGFANGVLRITGTTSPVVPQPSPEPNPTPGQPDADAQIVGINMSTDYDKSKKYHIGDTLSINWLTAKNFGDDAGTRTIELIVTRHDLGKSETEILQSHDVSLSAGEAASYLGVNYVFQKTGSYEFKWDDQIRTITVTDEPDDPRDAPSGFLKGTNIVGTHISVSGEDGTWNVNEVITIQSVRAENFGDEQGTKKIPFKIESPSGKTETLFQETFMLKPGESAWKRKDIKYIPSTPGWYQFEWGNVVFPFQIQDEHTDDPRDEPMQGISDIRGYQMIHWNPRSDPRLTVNDEIYFLLLVQNFGDASGSKTLDLKVTYLDSKNPTKTIHTEKFTLKPGEKITSITSYVPQNPGRYLFEWDDTSQTITILDKIDDPRDATGEGTADIRGAGIAWNAFVDLSGTSYNGEEFRFDLAAENYGDALGSKTIPFIVTILNDGKSVTKVLEIKNMILWPEERFNDVITFRPTGPGFYTFDWDGYTTSFEIGKSDDPRDESIQGKADIHASGFGWNAFVDLSGTSYNGEEFRFDLAAENYGDAYGSKNIPFTVTITIDGKSTTQTLRIESIALDSGEIFTDRVVFRPTGPGFYTFDWDGYTTSFEIGKSDDPRDESIQGFSDIKTQSVNILDNDDPKNKRFTPWNELRIEAGAMNHGDVVGTRDIDLLIERYYGGKLKEKYRIDTVQFTLKPEEYSKKDILFTPQEIGEYHVIWGELTGKFTVHSELSSHSRDTEIQGMENIRGLAIVYTKEHGTSPQFYANEKIYFHLGAKNFGDATGTKKLEFSITNFEDWTIETPYKKTYTLKPGEQQDNDRTVSYTPTKTGVYLLEWGDHRDYLEIKDRSDDPRDSTVNGKSDIRGRTLSVNQNTGYFVVHANAGNYGDAHGQKTLEVKMTSFVEGKAKTQTLLTNVFSLDPGQNKDINEMFLIETGGIHIFEFDKIIAYSYVSSNPDDNLIGVDISAKKDADSKNTGLININLSTANLGTEEKTRTIDLKAIRLSHGHQYTESIHQETFTLEPGETVESHVSYDAKESGSYVFVWDNKIDTVTVGDAQNSLNPEKGKLPSGCLIATATYGTELAPQVQLLREVRNNVLFSTSSGTVFMAGFNGFYYAFSPAVADLERQNPLFKEIVKVTIAPMLSTISILSYVDIDSEQEILGYGIGIILLNICLYFVVPAVVIKKIHSKIKNHRK